MKIPFGKSKEKVWMMEVGSWKLEDGRWMMDDGRWKMEDGSLPKLD